MNKIKFLTESKKPVKAKPIDIQILGVVSNMNGDYKDYFIGFDGEQYYLFTGSVCNKPESYFGLAPWEDELF